MTYGLVAIVKDEIDRIDSFIESVRAVCDGPLTIVDTGSTDGTLERLAELGITPHQVPFVNFGQARSAAFELARGKADWLLALDADMTVEIDPGFTPSPLADAYMIRMGTGDFDYRLPLLISGSLPWVSRGAVHEYTCLDSGGLGIRVPTDQVRVSTGVDRSSREKSLWHASLLESEMESNPDDPRTVFYLANTYWDLKDPRALATYERRSKMGGWDEETFYAKYRYALCLPSWPARMQALMAAWEFRPSRNEPVYELVRELNYRGLHQAAHRLVSMPVVPSTDSLFIHRSVERWGIPFEASIAEWWAGDRKRAYEIMDALLEMPELPAHIRAATMRNRGFGEADAA